MNDKTCRKPVFENGMAQPVFGFTDGKTGTDYDPETSEIVRYSVYVETDYDMNGDGQRDLVKAFVQLPRSAAEGGYRAASIFEARPYCAGVNADGYDHMKEVENDEYPPFDMDSLKNSPAPRVPEGEMTALECAAKADPSEWYYPDEGNDNAMCYEVLDNYNYYLVRGFAVVFSAGYGTRGSEGIEYTGSDLERHAFRCVVEWLHGDRKAYTGLDGRIETKADWSNGNVAMTGRSYAGTMPFAAAVTGVPGLKTIVPVAGIADWYSFLNQQGAQRYWPQEMLMSFLAYFCSSKYHDPEATEADLKRIAHFHQQFSMDQLQCGFDYDEKFWGKGNYTRNADLKCSALIVHGLNDENVSTKQFEMMYDTFVQAGQTVKLLLHQGPHMTPTNPQKNQGFLIDGMLYDDILNRWFSHYLYDVENDAEEMPNVLVQSNVDQQVWEKADSWHTEHSVMLESREEGSTVLGTDWADAGIDAGNFDRQMSTKSSSMNQRYLTETLTEDLTIQGSVRVDFTAALESGDAPDFGGSNVNGADKLSALLGTASGRMDDVKTTVLLVDLAEQAFDSFQTVDDARNVVNTEVVREGGIPNGGGLPAFDEIAFEPVHETYKVITRAYLDLCNPASGYAPETAAEWISLTKGEAHDYHVFLNTQRYTVKAGHRLAVVIGTEDPVNCLLHKNYEICIQDESVRAELPVTAAVTGTMDLKK